MKMSSPSSSRTGVSLTQMEESEPGERGEENLSESPTLRDPRGEEEGEGEGIYTANINMCIRWSHSQPTHLSSIITPYAISATRLLHVHSMVDSH